MFYSHSRQFIVNKELYFQPNKFSAWQKHIWEHFILNNLEFATSANQTNNAFVAIWYLIVHYLSKSKVISKSPLYEDMLYFKVLNNLFLFRLFFGLRL